MTVLPVSKGVPDVCNKGLLKSASAEAVADTL